MRSWSILTSPDATRSWFGPLGAIAAAVAFMAAVSAVRRGSAKALAVALAASPFLGIGILALALSYDPWRGRLLVAPWVMGVAVWSLLARRRDAEIALTVAGAITVVLCGVGFHGKPLGLSFVTGRDVPSVWRLDRWEVQTLVRGDGQPVLLAPVFARRRGGHGHPGRRATGTRGRPARCHARRERLRVPLRRPHPRPAAHAPERRRHGPGAGTLARRLTRTGAPRVPGLLGRGGVAPVRLAPPAPLGTRWLIGNSGVLREGPAPSSVAGETDAKRSVQAPTRGRRNHRSTIETAAARRPRHDVAAALRVTRSPVGYRGSGCFTSVESGIIPWA